jgi:hypothetical protein
VRRHGRFFDLSVDASSHVLMGRISWMELVSLNPFLVFPANGSVSVVRICSTSVSGDVGFLMEVGLF